MSKDIIVLAPNGRRQKVHCSPDTSVLQILEDVCQKQGFEAAEYSLKHHNHVLDLTTTVRFSNLPNKATLEMVESDKKREEKNVTIGLLLEDGERRTADFPPSTSLYEMITSLAPGEYSSLQHPTILYMRQEVTGESALRGKTLKQLGLISGRAILRLLNKAEEARSGKMSKDIIVLAPNGRRQKVHCSPDTSVLQILEDVCQKQGFEAAEYSLKHHNHVLDLTTTVRFSNLPNKATLEMVESDKKREEKNVTIGLLLEDGERRTADFPPSTSLYEMITSLAPGEYSSLQHPTILYMRQEVTGESALRGKTLKQLGLISGRAILRLLNKAEEARQANVSAVYRKASQSDPSKETHESSHNPNQDKSLEVDKNDATSPTTENTPLPGPSNVKKNLSIDPVKLIKQQKEQLRKHHKKYETIKEEQGPTINESDEIKPKEISMDVDSVSKSNTNITQENLERRLRIEDEVTFLGAQKAIAFTQPDDNEDAFDDLPDDFYELTVEEVRKLYHDLQQHRLELENTPLLTATARQGVEKQTSEQRLASYKNVVVRIQFPDNIILQGIFSPTNTIKDVINFIKQHLKYPEKPFHIFTTPLKESLDPDITLLQAKFVPCVHMHFKWLEDDGLRPCLKEEIYSRTTSSDAASLLASKYRAPPSRKKPEDPSGSRPSSSSNNSKIPKWFK